MPKYNLKGTKTEANLMEAFAGESQARNKYTYYASQARKDGYEQISELLLLTAEQEKEHAKMWFKLLHDGVPTTAINLADAAAGEHFEWTTMYKRMAEEARAEGFEEIAVLFEGVAAIEKEHELRYAALLAGIEQQTTFSKTEDTVWECGNCGHVHRGTNAPESCPVCDHPRSYFRVKASNY